MTIRTFGLTHLGLAVRDPQASAAFYGSIFGCEITAHGANSCEVQTPGQHDVIVFERDERSAGTKGGASHFGFRLVDPADIDDAVAAVLRAGGEVIERGEFGPGSPYAFIRDLDGYEVEIWYE